MASVISVNVGMSRDVDWRGKKVTTAIWKEPVAGPVRIGRLGADGDQQADLMGHGGEQRALDPAAVAKVVEDFLADQLPLTIAISRQDNLIAGLERRRDGFEFRGLIAFG